jgi:hypothetical protein
MSVKFLLITKIPQKMRVIRFFKEEIDYHHSKLMVIAHKKIPTNRDF